MIDGNVGPNGGGANAKEAVLRLQASVRMYAVEWQGQRKGSDRASFSSGGSCHQLGICAGSECCESKKIKRCQTQKANKGLLELGGKGGDEIKTVRKLPPKATLRSVPTLSAIGLLTVMLPRPATTDIPEGALEERQTRVARNQYSQPGSVSRRGG